MLKEQATQQKFALQDAEPDFGPPEQFAKMQRDEYAELGALIKAIGMKAQLRRGRRFCIGALEAYVHAPFRILSEP